MLFMCYLYAAKYRCVPVSLWTVFCPPIKDFLLLCETLPWLVLYVVLYLNCIFLISASKKSKCLLFYYLGRSIQSNVLRGKGSWVLFWDIWHLLWIRDICPNIILGTFIRTLIRDTGYLGSIIVRYGILGTLLNKPQYCNISHAMQ